MLRASLGNIITKRFDWLPPKLGSLASKSDRLGWLPSYLENHDSLRGSLYTLLHAAGSVMRNIDFRGTQDIGERTLRAFKANAPDIAVSYHNVKDLSGAYDLISQTPKAEDTQTIQVVDFDGVLVNEWESLRTLVSKKVRVPSQQLDLIRAIASQGNTHIVSMRPPGSVPGIIEQLQTSQLGLSGIHFGVNRVSPDFVTEYPDLVSEISTIQHPDAFKNVVLRMVNDIGTFGSWSTNSDGPTEGLGLIPSVANRISRLTSGNVGVEYIGINRFNEI